MKTNAKAMYFICMNNDGFDGLRRPRHILMERLAAAGHHVLFVSSAVNSISARKGKRLPFGGLSRMAPRLVWWQPPVLLRRFQNRLIDELSTRVRTLFLNVIRTLLGFKQPVLFISTPDDEYIRFALSHPEMAVIYNVHDRYLIDLSDEWIPAHFKLLRRANAILCTSRFLMDEIRPHAGATPLHYFPHAVDESLFLTPLVMRTEDCLRPLIGCVGNFGTQINWAMLAELIPKSEFDFVFAGPVTHGAQKDPAYRKLLDMPNARFLGEIPHERVPALIASFDVCILPYVESEYTKGVNPLKLLEFFALGKPVIATPIPELEYHDERIILASTAEEWSRAIADSLTGDSVQTKDARIRFAQANTYALRTNDLIAYALQLGRQQ